MTKKATDAALLLSAWNAGLKEPWHIDFDKEPVNDEKWSCIVTVAVQAEAQDEKWIQIYTQWVDTGLRKAVKIISMNDVVKLLKEKGKQEKSEKQGKNLKPSDSHIPQIVELAAKYAVISEAECTLPSDLMAAVLKYMILNLKNENCFAKRIAAVKERKIRERNIKAKFIRSLKPYETTQEERKSSSNDYANISEQEKPIDDEPLVGPDLYILLVDFYDVFVFTELQKINVPFLAIFKVSENGIWEVKQKRSILSTKSGGLERKRHVINSFWETLKEVERLDSEKFKNITILEYNPQGNQTENQMNSTKYVFDELTWMQYCAYFIYRQHQNYLKELYVQRLVLSLETLDLSKCKVYNKLCDALITGESLTSLLVLYAMVEQLVAGVPETKSMVLEYEPQFTDFCLSESESITATDNSSDLTSSLATSCKCRLKQNGNFAENPKKNFSNHSLSEKNERTESYEYGSVSPQSQHAENSSEQLSRTERSEFSISESLVDEVMSEKKTEKEMRNEKRWKTPSLCLYGDMVFLQTYFCDSRILSPKAVVERFLKKLKLPQIWKNYPELLPEEKVFYNFHFFSFLKSSEECEEKLKLQIFFTCLSLTLISVKKSNLCTGEEEKHSEILPDSFQEKIKLLKTKFSSDIKSTEGDGKGKKQSFQSFFLKNIIKKPNFSLPEKSHINVKIDEMLNNSVLKKAKSYIQVKTVLPRKTISEFKIFRPIQNTLVSFSGEKTFEFSKFRRSNAMIFSPPYNNNNKQSQNFQNILLSLIDCSEITNLTKHNFFRRKADLKVIEDYKFYEKLNPSLMIQRLTEAEKNFNTVQCTYFPLVDSIVIIMHNDHDERGIFFYNEQGVLPTPVSFRDFYSYVCPKIKNWLILKNNEFLTFVSEIKEKERAEEEKKDAKYLAKLKKEYCEMSEEKRKEFMETDVDVWTEPEISEEELGDLPVKPKLPKSEKISFVVTNFVDLRVETNQKAYEYYSSDGTEVYAAVETWLYTPLRLHKLAIKKSALVLYYNHWLDDEKINFSFTLKTTSNIIFSFYKDEEMDDFNYHVTISWPTGLLIKPVFRDSNTYIKQSYLKTYRKGWDIEEERSRCFLKNGQVLIFKENGNYDVLCGSGTKYAFKDSETKYEIISTTGEIWEVRSNTRCRNKKEFIGSNKVFVGVDPKTQETFCRREDGVFLMLWQNGTLVTNYPDGTKITSTPYFEEREVIIEWTEEEKLFYEDLYRSEISVQEPRSRTVLRNISVPKSIDKKNFVSEGFISVLCEYVMEHPKYSTVYFNKDPYIKMRMPEQLSISIHPSGNYEIQQEKDFVKVKGNIVRFYTECDSCKDQSTVILNVDSNEVLCRCVDFFKKAFFVFRNGHIIFKKFYKEPLDDRTSDGKEECELKKAQEKSESKFNECANGHNKKMASMHRCFILYRDLNGMEFIHADTFKDYCYRLPEETYFDIDTDDPLNISYTFSSPKYKIGHEKWVMDYENAENSLPTSIKKKDLKELGTKETPKKLFKYPFPRQRIDRQQNEKPKHVINMPKLIMGRTVRCLCDEPSSVIHQMQFYVAKYQKRADDLYKKYKSQMRETGSSQESNCVEMRLRKIAFALNQNFQMYPHLGTQLPSTEKEIHYFGHFIKSMDGMKNRLQDSNNILPDCKQIPKPLPGLSDLPDIYEEIE